jgi:hypothetical protein
LDILKNVNPYVVTSFHMCTKKLNFRFNQLGHDVG